jgi:hypothetical protein
VEVCILAEPRGLAESLIVQRRVSAKGEGNLSFFGTFGETANVRITEALNREEIFTRT